MSSITKGQHVAKKASLPQQIKAAWERAKRRAARNEAQYESWAATETEWEDYAW
ncbi:hypothetical protein SEA_MUFASA8_39 [Arthrobacter phage Mufasa8]|uniref:Uncharacterized protein n=1 Tax=Arthrobacter phage Mufasa8 TaxID=2656526 RepID=A0A649VMC2_9CAUD|nr:hypothetical protein HYQ08_gp039 [Arthrobacter phage Mufasa8]QGJ93488.1 hypothetical protein SEA_MUFASA8_39 [Arthrobacter phage Mufasa8]